MSNTCIKAAVCSTHQSHHRQVNYVVTMSPVKGWHMQSLLAVDVFEAGKMAKCKDLSDSDKSQIVMARQLSKSISGKPATGS